MKMYAEPDEGTIMIWIDELNDLLFKEINNILIVSRDEIEDEDDEEYKYVIDTNFENYEKIKYILKLNYYLITEC